MNISISPLSAGWTTKNYDFALGAVGYESRASHAFSCQTGTVGRGGVLVFEEQEVLYHSANKKYFANRKFDLVAPSVEGMNEWLSKLPSKTEGNHTYTLIIDISSMTKKLIASLCFALKRLAETRSFFIDVDFVYSIAEFGEIPSGFGPLVSNGPSIKDLAGWSKNPSLPCAVVLGIGYEEDLALGVMEDLEASRVWAFRPKDHDPRYDNAIDDRNKGLFDLITPKNLIRYSVFDPYTTYVAVEALISLSKSDYRLIVVPLGPKIFALASCLAVLNHYPEVGFWRVSGGINVRPVDRKALGTILGLSVAFSP